MTPASRMGRGSMETVIKEGKILHEVARCSESVVLKVHQLVLLTTSSFSVGVILPEGFHCQ